MTNKRLKTGGREKGTPNKINAELRALISELAMSEFQYVQEHLEELDLLERYRFAVALGRFIIAPPTKELPYYDPPIIHIMKDL